MATGTMRTIFEPIRTLAVKRRQQLTTSVAAMALLSGIAALAWSADQRVTYAPPSMLWDRDRPFTENRSDESLPAGAIARLGTSYLRAPNARIALTADGGQIVALGPDLIVRRFDATTGIRQSVRPLVRGRGSLVCLSLNGKLALTVARDTIKGGEWLELWDTASCVLLIA